jgi:hypothetical protein
MLKDLEQVVRETQKNFPKGNFKDKDYIKKIIRIMYAVDQYIRQNIPHNYVNDSESNKLLNLMSKFHTKQLKKIMLKNGWLRGITSV